jgi:YggT family protein
VVSVVWQIVYLLLWLFRLALLLRIVFEFVRMFARAWRPAGTSAVALEILYSSTDPPVRLLRRLIPTVRVGGVGFDLSIIVLLVVIFILMVIVGRLAFT